jgi:hypothetical protein
MINQETDLDFLIWSVRRKVGDLTEPYTYSDELIRSYLVEALRVLGGRWRNRYLIDGDYVVTRNTSITTFTITSPPVIEQQDQEIIALQAAIMIKSNAVYDSSWDVASWKDNEIAYSNIQGGKIRDLSLDRDIALLEALLDKNLHPGKTQSLPGFHPPYNTIEGGV